MSAYDLHGAKLASVYDRNGSALSRAYGRDGSIVFPDWPAGDLCASSVVPLPDLYESGKGFTCTGLAYDPASDSFLVGDIGILLPNSGTINSQIVRLSPDLRTVKGTIPLYQSFPGMGDIQGITVDHSDGSIWFCAPSANRICHTNAAGENLGSISVTKPTGIAYSGSDDSFWVLNYSNQILHLSKTGTVLECFSSAFGEGLDQCFLDSVGDLLYITAGTNYTGRNKVYCFRLHSHEQFVACTVDSYSVEGIWIGSGKMVIVNDGYYHSAAVPVNQANLYLLGSDTNT